MKSLSHSGKEKRLAANPHTFLIVGSWQYEIYEEAFSDALEKQNVVVHKCVIRETIFSRFSWLSPKLGFTEPFFKKKVLKACKNYKPSHLLLWRLTELNSSSLRDIRRNLPDIKIITFNNDDPFNLESIQRLSRRYYWHNHLDSLREADLAFVYRPQNVKEAQRYGVSNVQLLKPYFIPEIHQPISYEIGELFRCDLVFIGHYEPDGREDYIKALVKNGYVVRIWGGGAWTKQVLGDSYNAVKPKGEVRGNQYIEALSGGKVCLAFLSEANRDVYTRRCFEIPACEKLLFCQRTRELTKMFKEDEEAVFFDSIDEMLQKMHWLTSNVNLIDRIAKAGRKRVLEDGHSVDERVRQFLKVIRQCE